MYTNEEYELGNVGEDFGLQPIGDEDGTFDDDEAFGDTGPLNDDWEQNHELLAQEHEQYLTNEGRGRQEHKGEDEEDFDPYSSMEGRGNAGIKRESHTKMDDARYSTPTHHSTSSWSANSSSLHASHGVDDEYLEDQQLEDMFKGVLSDESERDHYSNSSQYLRSPQTHQHQHFMGSPMDKLTDSPAHPSIWGRSPATQGSMWGTQPNDHTAHQEPHQGPGPMANASPPPPGFAQLQKGQFPAQGFPGQFSGQQFQGQQLPPPQPFPGHQQIPDHPISSLAPKMLSVEEIEARMMRQAQPPPQHMPPQHIPPQHIPPQHIPPQHIPPQQLQQLHPQLQQSPPQGAPLAILQQLQQLQHMQQMRQLQFLQQQMQLSSPHDQANPPPAGKPQPNLGPGHTTQVYVRKNSNNFQQQNYRPVNNDGNNNNNNNNNNYHTNHYANNQKQPRGITLGDMLPSMKTGRGGHSTANGATRGTRYERKLMMTPDEIDAIIHMQHAQLHSNHPYTDDYYYYQLQKRRGSQPLTRDEPPDIVRHHKPLCESVPSRTFPPKKIINDPLAGSLGRIPSHNVRAPRTLLQLVAAEMEETEEGNKNNNNNNAINLEDRTELGVHQSLLLAVENAFNHLLDIEDIDLILSSSNGSVNVTHLLQKRDELSMDLFKSLNFDSYPLTKTSPPVPLPLQPFSLGASGSIPTSASINARIIPQVVQEDEFFVSLALISKGKKLLARAIPLFPASIAVPVLLAFMRNFLFLLAHNEREKEKDKGSKMFVHLNFLIGGLATPHVLLAFHTLLLFHGEMAILKLLQYQECVDVILNFMRRGHELTQEGGGANAAHVPPAAHWRGMFGEFLKRVSYGRTLPPLHSRPFMWELVLAMAVDADDYQRSMIAENMKENITSQPHPEQLPSAQNLRNLLNL